MAIQYKKTNKDCVGIFGLPRGGLIFAVALSHRLDLPLYPDMWYGDIDDRILPNGEYRSAQNIQVTTSEGSDVGSIQNILGNTRIINSVLDQYSDLENIGCFFDEKNNKIFYFVTNYTCPNPEDTGLVGGVLGPETAEQFALRTGDNLFCGIFMTTKADGDLFPQAVLLAQGLFFNFSKTHLITGVNLLEELLFFTDGLNQPRKINVSIAADNPPNISKNIPGHYNKEDKVSVAKFAPFMPPLLLDYDTTTLNGNPQATTTDDFGNVTNVHPTSSMELSYQNDFTKDFLREKNKISKIQTSPLNLKNTNYPTSISPEEIVINITANELTKVPGLPSSTINKIISFFRNPTKKPYQTTDPNDPKLSE